MFQLFAFGLLLISLIFPAHANAQETIIRVNYADSYPPLSSGHGKDVEGVLPALIEHIIAEDMGYKVVHNGTAWKRAQKEVWRGEADILITSINPDRLEHSFSSEQAVFKLTFRPFTRKGSAASKALASNPSIESLSNFQFCDVHGNLWGKRFYEKHKINFHLAKSFETCLKLMLVGRTDIIIHSDHILMDLIQRNDLQDDIEVHPQVMPESPDFYLLLSKKSKLNRAFLAEFDLHIAKQKSDGSFQRLLTKLNMESGIVLAFTEQ